jgi:hypothetical protein
VGSLLRDVAEEHEAARLWVDLELELSRHRQRLAAGEQGDP